ncbi:integrin alpha-6-like [Engraulis encrasicolus]|uniref:integrin alpha-6-like n=1 Tax=Engraulis encrasicolus TaxID=184585 RepID=UPI002FD172AE
MAPRSWERSAWRIPPRALATVLAWCQFARLSAFNLDTSGPLRRDGDPNSLFGFSLAMHHQRNPVDSKVLLVGAPHAKALGNQRANITGGLYSCTFTPGTSGCQRIQFDDTDTPQDHKEDQWMGSRVRSQGPGGKVVVCAHRYQFWVKGDSDRRLIAGRCMILEEDLTLPKEEEDPDTEDSGIESNWDRHVCTQGGRIDQGITKERFAFCQQGMSPAFTADKRHILFGAPGVYDGKGIVRLEPVEDRLAYEAEFLETGDDNKLEEQLVPVNRSSYLGFSLGSSTALTKKGELIIVAGAPRAWHSGQVLLLRREGSSSLNMVHRLTGPDLASSFGYDLAVVDLNADGWEDLVVGAPQYFEKDGEVGGAVYVYINRAGGRDWNNPERIRLRGNKDSMFGLAVESIGDVNQDGFQDIAVGAPYEGSGCVYIYHGSAEGIERKYAQILRAEGGAKLFGYALAGNMDIDGNQYPDVAVGSLSDSVFIYRARPVIDIKRTMKISPDKIDIKKQKCDLQPCKFTIQSCFSYSSHSTTYQSNINIRYTLDTDGKRREWKLPSRVQFEVPSHAEGQVKLLGPNKEECVSTQIRLQTDVQDKMSAIPISLLVSLQNERSTSSHGSTHASSLPELTPVTSPQDKLTQAELRFVNTGCGSDGICHSNLALQYQFVSMPKPGDADHVTPLQSENGTAVISATDSQVRLHITVTNKAGEDAHHSQLQVTLPESLPYFSHSSKDKSVYCRANKNGTQVDCELGNPLPRDAEVHLYLTMSTKQITIETSEVNATLQLKTISAQNISAVEARARFIFDLDLQVFGAVRPRQLSVGGDVKAEDTVTSEEDIGSLVQFEFRINNMGGPLKSMATASLNLQWPRMNNDNKWLLYLVAITDGRREVACSPQQEVNPLKHVKTQHVPRGKRQAVESNLEALSTDGILSIFGGKRKYKTLSCGDEVNCVTIKCPLLGWDSNTMVIWVRSRVWNTTFLEDYESFNHLNIVVNASLSLDSALENIALRSTNTQVTVTVFPERKNLLQRRVPWWVILLSVLLALLLLALLGFILWKVGCFTHPMCAKKKEKYYIVSGEDTASPKGDI